MADVDLFYTYPFVMFWYIHNIFFEHGHMGDAHNIDGIHGTQSGWQLTQHATWHTRLRDLPSERRDNFIVHACNKFRVNFIAF